MPLSPFLKRMIVHFRHSSEFREKRAVGNILPVLARRRCFEDLTLFDSTKYVAFGIILVVAGFSKLYEIVLSFTITTSPYKFTYKDMLAVCELIN